MFRSGQQQIVFDTMNVGLNVGDGGCGRGKFKSMPLVAVSRIEDLGMVDPEGC